MAIGISHAFRSSNIYLLPIIRATNSKIPHGTRTIGTRKRVNLQSRYSSFRIYMRKTNIFTFSSNYKTKIHYTVTDEVVNGERYPLIHVLEVGGANIVLRDVDGCTMKGQMEQ